MTDAVLDDGVLERSDHMGLTDEFTEGARAIATIERLVGHDASEDRGCMQRPSRVGRRCNQPPPPASGAAMIDFAKKIRKSCAGDLEPGEEVVAATFVQPPGAIRRQVAFGAIGGAVGAVAGEAMASTRTKNAPQQAGEGFVVDIPAGKAVLGLTDRRFLVFGHSSLSGKPKGLNASFTLDQVQSIALTTGKLTGSLVVTFVDGTAIDFDVVKTAKPEPFVAAFTQLTGR